MKQYVAGFYFDDNYEKVALVLKNRPRWQRGRFNAIGGKIESGETATEAMSREFAEETGVADALWDLFLILHGKDWDVYFFRGCGDPHRCITREDEKIEVFTVDEALTKELIPNLHWILPLALDRNINGPILVGYHSETL